MPENSQAITIDRTYPFGGTQRGAYQVHSGVEFFNPRFSPVIAADTGTVFYAGTDIDPIFGPYADYYGNVVVIDHGVRQPEGQTVYTLYGHLEDITIETGQYVQRGEQIGRVGATGIAIGSHLHFEVRVGDPYDFYESPRNPDLYIYPMEETAMLVGRVVDPDGNFIPEVPILLRRAGTNGRAIYETFSYGEGPTNPTNVWNENFTRGDIRPGEYEVFVNTLYGQTVFEQEVSIQPGNATFVEIVISADLQFYPDFRSESADDTELYPTETPTPLPPDYTPEPSATTQSFG